MASRDLTAAFTERRTMANLRRRGGGGSPSSTSDNGDGISSWMGRSQNNNGHGNHLLTENGFPNEEDDEEEGNNMQRIQSPSSPSSTTTLPPQWVDDVDAIHNEIADIRRYLRVLISLHSSRVGSVFRKDLDDLEGKIDQLTRDITDRFRIAERLVQRVGITTKRAGGTEATVGANVQRSLAKKLQELSVEFRQKQRKYLDDLRAQTIGGAGQSSKFGIDFDTTTPHNNTTNNNNITNDLLLNQEEEDEIPLFSTTPTSKKITTLSNNLHQTIQSRNTEIQHISRSIEELNSIFKELAVLVIDQGTILDRIDYNMEAVVEHTKEGMVQLERAEESQKQGRPMKCILSLMGLIGFLLVILIWKYDRRFRH